MDLGRLLHFEFFSSAQRKFVADCFQLKYRTEDDYREKYLSLVGKKCATDQYNTMCEFISSQPKYNTICPAPQTYWLFSRDTISSESSLNLSNDGKCHFSLKVSPRHEGDRETFDGNNLLLMKFFQTHFTMNNVFSCIDESELCLDKSSALDKYINRNNEDDVDHLLNESLAEQLEQLKRKIK